MTAHNPKGDHYDPDTMDEREDQEHHSTGNAVDVGFNNLESKIDTYFGQVFRWFNKHDASQTTMDRLTSQRTNCEARGRKLQDQLHEYSEKIKFVRNERQELRQMYNDCQDEVDKLKKEKSKLRNVILKQAGSERISDEEIKKMFSSMRQKIQAIAHSKAFCLAFTITVSSRCDAEVHKFWDTWNGLSLGDRASIMRGKIFTMLLDHILEQNLFGICPIHHQHLEQIEDSLKGLEEFMAFHKVPLDAIVDWRHATMKAVEQTKIEHTYDDGVASIIMSYFNCLIPRDLDPVVLQKLHHDIHDLCQNAYQLRFLMRKSKDNYTCEGFVAGDNVHDHESALEVHGVLRGGDESSIVAYTICGALIKSSWNHDMEPVVLEPAHVVVKHV